MRLLERVLEVGAVKSPKDADNECLQLKAQNLTQLGQGFQSHLSRLLEMGATHRSSKKRLFFTSLPAQFALEPLQNNLALPPKPPS